MHVTFDQHLGDGVRERGFTLGDVPGVRFIYTDERAIVGHYVEHVWFGAELEAQLAAAVPTYRTR